MSKLADLNAAAQEIVASELLEQHNRITNDTVVVVTTSVRGDISLTPVSKTEIRFALKEAATSKIAKESLGTGLAVGGIAGLMLGLIISK